jgi:hypothetical protein
LTGVSGVIETPRRTPRRSLTGIQHYRTLELATHQDGDRMFSFGLQPVLTAEARTVLVDDLLAGWFLSTVDLLLPLLEALVGLENVAGLQHDQANPDRGLASGASDRGNRACAAAVAPPPAPGAPVTSPLDERRETQCAIRCQLQV